MTKRTEAAILACLDSIASDGRMNVASKAAGLRSDSTLFDWISASREAAAADDRTSEWFLTWRGHQGFFYPGLMATARQVMILTFEGTFRHQAAFGISEPARDSSTGYPLQQRNMANWFKTDAEIEAMLDDPLSPEPVTREQIAKAKYLWLDEQQTQPLLEMVTTQIPASARVKVATATMRRYGYGDQIQIDSTVTHVPVMQIEHPKFVSNRPTPLQLGELPSVTVETEEPERVPTVEDITRLRKEAAERHLSDPTRPGARHAGDPVEHAGKRRADGKDYVAAPPPPRPEPPPPPVQPPPPPLDTRKPRYGQPVQQQRPTEDGGSTPEPMSSSANPPARSAHRLMMPRRNYLS